MSVLDNHTLTRAKQGDMIAFEKLFEATHSRIYNFLLHLSGDRDLAADLTQETYLRAWKSLASLKDGRAINAWLHQIALNLFRDEKKKRRLDTVSFVSFDRDEDGSFDFSGMIADNAPLPDKRVLDSELQVAVQTAIQSLPEKHRIVVVLHHIQGMGLDEIAEILGTRKGTVMSRLARARDTLRRRLVSYVGGEL